ncbi:MAG: hypothetical protein U0641_06385 [Anaerolineae bacterium]
MGLKAAQEQQSGTGVWIAWLVGAAVVIGAALRLWGLNHFPPGLSVDEAYNLIDAQRILDGARPLFLPDNAGREALYSYWQAILVAALGPAALALRLASAVLGIATIPLTYWAAKELPWPRARLIAAVAAALLAALFWHVLFSRFGIRAISLPLLEALFLGWLWRGLVRARPLYFALAGAALGLAVYTGTAARLLPIVPLVSLPLFAWLDPDRRPLYLRGLAWTLGVAALVVAPLAVYFYTHPAQFGSHLSEVAVGPADIAANVARVAGMFNLRGDTAWWRNLAGRPAFDPLIGLAFLAGIALLAWRLVPLPPAPSPMQGEGEPEEKPNLAPLARSGRGAGGEGLAAEAESSPPPPLWGRGQGGEGQVSLFLLIWLAVMLVPTIAADGAPNFSRAIGILPVATIIPAAALVEGWAWLAERRRVLADVALVAVIAVSFAWTAWDYFGVFATRPEAYYAYDADKADAAAAIVAARGTVHVAANLADHATVRALTEGRDVRAYDFSQGFVMSDGPASYVAWAKDGLPAGVTRWGTPRTSADAQGAPLVAVTTVETPPDPGQVRAALGMTPGQVRFGDAIGLAGYHVEPTRLTFMWRALGVLPDDLTLFVHVLGADGQTVAQADGEPLGATYPTSRWRVGERIVESRALPPLPPGQYRVQVGWYNRASGERLPVAGSAENAVDLGTLTVD